MIMRVRDAFARAGGRVPRRRWDLALPAALLALLLAVPAQAQQTRVVGTVTSAETGGPLAGVNVTVQGTPIGTLTNADGRFTLQVPSPDATLVFALIGHATQEVALDGQTQVSVALEVEAVGLQEIVVTGYGTQRKRDVTGSVSSIEGSDVTDVATPSVVQSLQGKVAGVQVTPTSGEPGQDAAIRIRGVGTLNDASPLFVVDGMLTDDIQFLSPQDVESVEVLKDASATAIYGSRGANGVIIITTRKGEEAQGTTYRFHAYGGTQSVLDPIDLVSAEQYAMLSNELAENEGQPTVPFPSGYTGPETDWQDEIFESAAIQNYQFTASGGTDRVTYYFSTNYINQAGVVPHSEFERVTVRLNNDYELSDAITIGHNLNFSYTDDQRPPSVLSELYRAEPTVSPRTTDGDFTPIELSSAGNPAATVFYTNNEGTGQRLVGNVYGEASFLDNFTFRSSFGLDYERTDFRRFVPVFVVDAQQQNEQSDLRVEFENTDSWLWENTLTWNYLTDEHRLTLLGGITAQAFEFEDVGGERFDIAGDDPSLWYLNAGATEGTNFNSAYEWKMLSYLARVNYTFLDRYMFTGSMRVDGSSRFGEDNRYGYFPSVAVGWDLAQEAFLSDVDYLQAFKLRASWGKIGNDKIGAYPSQATVSGDLNYVLGDQLSPGAAPVSLANPEVKWEATEQYNFGLDASLFRGRVQTTLEYYNRTTDGILVRVPIPNYVGVNQEPFVNAAEVRNRGFEGALSWFGRLGELGLELSANGSTIDNEVLELGEGREEIFGGGIGVVPFTTRTVPGHPIGSFWGFRVDGVFQTEAEIAGSATRGGEQPGDLKYADINGRDENGELTGEPDGVINNDDMTFIGSPIPDFVYGFDATLRYGAFDLSMGFSGQSGNEVFNAKRARRFNYENYEEQFLDRWHGEGTSDTEPRVTTSGHNYQSSERWIEDGSFLKLHSAQIGFRLPQSVVARAGVDLARIYVSGTNLALWTDYTGYTPEITGNSVIAWGLDEFSGVYPPSRIITVGIDMSF